MYKYENVYESQKQCNEIQSARKVVMWLRARLLFAAQQT